jgi:hypothetical protein
MSYSATVSAQAVDNWTRILYPTVSSDSAPLIISRIILLGIRVFRGPKLPKTRCKLIVGATTVVKRDIKPTDLPSAHSC